MAEPTVKEMLAGILAGQAAQAERLDALESGVEVEAPTAAPAAKAPAKAAGKGPGKPNRFTPAAVLRMVPVPTTVGEVVEYANAKGESKPWKVVGIGPVTLDGETAEEGAILARRA